MITLELRRLAVTILVAQTYADYVDELARISDLYYATVKRAAKEPAAIQDDPMD